MAVVDAPAAAAAFSRPPDGVVITSPNTVAQFWMLDYHAVFGKNIGVRRAEVQQMADILAGRSDRGWVDASLARLGCTFED